MVDTKPLFVVRSKGAKFTAVRSLSSDLYVVGFDNGHLEVHSRNKRRAVGQLQAHSSMGVLATEVFNNLQFISHGRDGKVVLWDTNTLKQVESFAIGSYTFNKVAPIRWPCEASNHEFSSILLVPSNDPTQIDGMDVRSKSCKFQLKTPTKGKSGMVMAMRLFTTSGGSSLAALGNEDGSVNLYDLRRSKPLTNCSIFDEPLLCLDVDKTGKSFICGSSTHHLVRMHMCYTQQKATAIQIECGSKGGFSDVRIRSDQKIFATGGWDHRIRLFQMSNLKPLAILKYHQDTVSTVDFNPWTNALVAGGQDKRMSFWEVFS